MRIYVWGNGMYTLPAESVSDRFTGGTPWPEVTLMLLEVNFKEPRACRPEPLTENVMLLRDALYDWP